MLKRELVLTILLMVSYSSFCYAVKTAKHILDSNLEYSEGEFEWGIEGSSHYAKPYQPKNPPPQSAKVYKEHLQLLPYEETILKRVVPGKDARTRVEETTKWPFHTKAQLGLYFSDGEYGGSGVLVGPHHLLTCAHNIYNEKGEWVTKVLARIALNNAVVPFGEIKAVRIYTFTDWIDSRDPKFDIALIVLGQSIGHQTGWSGLLSLGDEEITTQTVHITGYPGDKGFNQMWTMEHKIKSFEEEQFYYDIDTEKGQSGSPVWIKKLGYPYTIGIHTLGEGTPYLGNSGVRLSKNKFDIISKWISETLNKKQEIPKTISTTISSFSKSSQTSSKKDATTTKSKVKTQKSETKAKTAKTEKSLASIANGIGIPLRNLKDDNESTKSILKKVLDKGESFSSTAKSLDLDPSTISNLVNGKTKSSPKTVDAIRTALKNKNSDFYKTAKKISKKSKKK